MKIFLEVWGQKVKSWYVEWLLRCPLHVKMRKMFYAPERNKQSRKDLGRERERGEELRKSWKVGSI